ncbi:MAG: hypothetical protein QGG84_12715, partial [Rhodospirillales bacterium]|nr:hypothetical protein [Rhodospirillales bacterium]
RVNNQWCQTFESFGKTYNAVMDINNMTSTASSGADIYFTKILNYKVSGVMISINYYSNSEYFELYITGEYEMVDFNFLQAVGGFTRIISDGSEEIVKHDLSSAQSYYICR